MDKINALLIYEILGRPPEHIKEALEKFTDDFNGKTGIKLLLKKVHEPKLLEKEHASENLNELYTTFAEVELEIENLNILFNIILNTLPARVEVLSPSSLILKNFDISEVLNDLSIKLHKYDEVTKVVTFERNSLLRKLRQIEEESEKPELNIKTNINPDTENKKNKSKKIKKKKK